MKKLLYAIVAFSMIFVLSGCNDSDSKEENTKIETETESKKDDKATETPAKAEESAASNSSTTTAKPSTSKPATSNSASTSKPATTKPSTSASKPASTPSKPASTPAPSKPAATPTCSHNWVAETTTKWVQTKAAYDETVVVKAAWTEKISYALFKDGHKAYTSAEMMAYQDYLNSKGMNAGYSARYETINHPAETKTVHHNAEGHNETVNTGHYHCSKCGATK